MHFVGAADGLRPRFGQADEAHLSLLHEACHRADRVLDRHFRIDAVLVVQVDRLLAQPLEARLASLRHVFGAAIDGILPALDTDLSELGHQHHAIAAALDRAADQFLVMAPAVHVRGVEMVHAHVDRAADQILRRPVIGIAIDAGERHAAEPDRGDREPAATERTMLH